MDNNIFAGQWKQLRGQAKVMWAKLTDDDVKKIDGNYDKFIGTLQEKYGYTRQQAEDEFKKRTA